MCREHLLCAEGCPATQTGRAGVDKDQEILKHWFSHSLEKCQRSSNTRVAGELHTRQALITQAWCNFSCHVAHLLLFFFFYFQRVTLNHGCWKIVSRLFFWFTWCRFLSMRAEQVSEGADRSCGMGTESGSWCWHLHSTSSAGTTEKDSCDSDNKINYRFHKHFMIFRPNPVPAIITNTKLIIITQ